MNDTRNFGSSTTSRRGEFCGLLVECQTAVARAQASETIFLKICGACVSTLEWFPYANSASKVPPLLPSTDTPGDNARNGCMIWGNHSRVPKCCCTDCVSTWGAKTEGLTDCSDKPFHAPATTAEQNRSSGTHTAEALRPVQHGTAERSEHARSQTFISVWPLLYYEHPMM